MNILNKDIIIRKIEHSDYHKGHLSLYHQNFTIDPEKINYEDYVNYINNQVKNNYYIFVCELNNKIVASATCYIEVKLLHNFGKVAHLEDVITDKNCRNNGLGKKIINYCCDFAKNNDCYKIILNCSNENIKFYEKCNFVINGNEMSHYY